MVDLNKGFSLIIPNIIPYQSDEWFLSWIYRLAKRNGLSLKSFRDSYLYYLKNGARINLEDNFLKICLELGSSVDIIKIFRDTMLFPFEAMAWRERKQAAQLMRYFQPNLAKGLEYKAFSVVSSLRFCKECMEEDIEKHGFVYAHRVHQLSGVKTCCYHKTRLYHYRQANADISIIMNRLNGLEPVSNNNITDFEVQYADFSSKLLEANENCNAEILKLLFQKEFTARGLEGKIIKACEERFSVKMPRSPYDFYNMTHVVPILIYLYSNNFTKFKDDLKKYSDIYYDKRIKLLNLDCVICDYGIPKKVQYGKQIICQNLWGSNLLRTLIDFDGKTKSEALKRLVEYSMMSEYTWITNTEAKPLNSWNDVICLKHTPCNEELSCNVFEFVFGYQSCNCENKLHYQKAKKAIESVDGFKLKRLLACSKGNVEIYHEGCRHTFITQFYRFIERKRCLCCGGQRNAESFRDEVKALVGEEYQLLTDYKDHDTKVRMLHTECGHEFEMLPWVFIEGARCPHCNKSLYFPEFSSMVTLFSSGHYQAVKRLKGHYVLIKNNISGKEFSMKMPSVKQELFRPTKSPILILSDAEELKRQKIISSDKGDKYMGVNKVTKLYQWLRTRYKLNDIIYINDIKTNEEYQKFFKGSRANDLFLALKESGSIRQIDRSMFVFSENKKEYLAEDIATARYIDKNGENIGEWINVKTKNRDGKNYVERRILTDLYNESKDWTRVKIGDFIYKIKKR